MQSRRRFFRVASTAMALGHGIAQVRPRTIYATGAIELPFGPKAHLRQLIARLEGLYALASTPTGGEVIHADLTGRVLSRRPTPPGTFSFLVAANGELVTLRPRGKSSVISGHSVSEVTRPEALYTIAFLGSNVVGFGRNTLHTDLSQATAPTVSLPNDNLLAGGLPDGSLALVAKQEQTLWHLDTGLRMTAGIQLIAPELRSVARAQQDDGSAIYAMCADESHDLYCLATPYSGPEGARLLRFGINGNLKDRMFLVMPEFPETTGHGDGRLQAGRMALHGKTVFVGSGTGTTTRVAYFSIG